MTPNRAAALVLVALAAIVGAGGRAEAGPLYDQALAAYERVEYADVVRLLDRALPTESLTQQELEHAYWVLGSALLGDAQGERASRVFLTRCVIAGEAQPERDASPRVIDAFKKACAALSGRPVVVAYTPATQPPRRPGADTPVAADMLAPPPLEPALQHQAPGAPPTRVRLRCERNHCTGVVPAEREEFSLGFLTPEGGFVPGTAVHHLVTVAVTQAKPAVRTPLYKRWWLWTAVGAVVVGTVVGTAVGVTLTDRQNRGVELSIRKPCGGDATCPLWSTP